MLIVRVVAVVIEVVLVVVIAVAKTVSVGIVASWLAGSQIIVD